jgi:hypothetical protein
MKYTVQYVHKVGGLQNGTHNVEYLNQDLTDRVKDGDRTGLAALLRSLEVLAQGARVREMRVETDGRIVVFPTLPGMTTR